jgi:predicted secreted protein
MERMEKQLTAVEWLFEQVWITSGEDLPELLEQAKEMEKEQIEDAWNNGYREFYDGSSTPEEYYNETFKSE